MSSRKYRTTIYRKAQENIRERRKEAMKIVEKSKIVENEYKFLYITLGIIITMLVMLPFIIVWKNRKYNKLHSVNNNNTKDVALNEVSTSSPSSSSMSSSTSSSTAINSSSKSQIDDVQKIINDAGMILDDIKYSEILK